MVLPLLLLLLASLQTLPRPVSPADLLPAPTLSQYPSYTVYFPGQWVTLMCMTTRLTGHSQYRFFYQKNPQTLSTVLSTTGGARLKLTAGKESAGSYTCAYFGWQSNRLISSENSSSVYIAVADPLPAPQLTVSPQQPVYIAGETVNLICSAAKAPTVSRVQFFKDSQEIRSPELTSSWNSNTFLLRLPEVSGSQPGAYSCGYWKAERGREIPSERSRPIFIAVTDPPPKPVLSMDPSSGAVSEGLPLLLICTVPGNTSQRRFQFYKDDTKIVPGDLESEIGTTETSNSSMNVSVLRIPRAGPNVSGEFTCGYEENLRGRWVLSPRSQAMNVTVTASHRTQNHLLTAGGALLAALPLAALICCFRRKKRVRKPLRSTKEFEAQGHARKLDLSHNKEAKVMGAGEHQMEEDSEVTYAVIAPAVLEAHTTQSKTRLKPYEEEHVLYSEIVTKPTWKAAN